MAKISFITFTRNSADRIANLLEHVKDIVDEIIVIDGCSSDGTVEIAKKFGSKVYIREPHGYPELDMPFALSVASHEWVLRLDDDERLNQKLKNDLRSLIESANETVSAFNVTRVNLSHNKVPLYGPFYPDPQIRIFKKHKVSYKGLVHEVPKISGKIISLPSNYFIIHLSKDKGFWPKKMSIYAFLEALQYYEHKTRSKLRKMLWHLALISAPLICLYHISLSMYKEKKPLNVPTLVSTLKIALYEALVHTLMRIRSKKEKERAKLIEKKGLIYPSGLARACATPVTKLILL